MRPPAWLRACGRWAGAQLAVVAQPAGVPVQAGSGLRDRDTVDFWLPALEAVFSNPFSPYPAAAGGGADSVLRLVHRLDADVSGLLLLARGRAAAERVRAALAARSGIVKEYVALVPAPLPRGVAAAGRIVAAVDGADALTEYVAAAVGGGSHTLLLLRPVSGRKHQLRQHVRALWRGTAAIAGDEKYGDRGSGGGGGGEPRPPLMLHAWRLRLSRTVISDGDGAAAPPPRAAATAGAWLREVRAACAVQPQPPAAARVDSDGAGGVVITDADLPAAFRAHLAPLLQQLAASPGARAGFQGARAAALIRAPSLPAPAA